MLFSPCIDKCNYDTSACEGCGRSREEINENKKLVMSIVNFIQEQEYENPEEYLTALNKSVLKKLKR